MRLIEFLTDVRSLVTLISFITFVGILWWTYVTRGAHDFDRAAMLPFDDEPEVVPGGASISAERRHG